MSEGNNSEEVVRLPLWRECVKEMVDQGLEYGKVYPSAYFEKWLRCEPESMALGLGISEIRRVLETHGRYLSGRGQKGEQYVILPPASNRFVMNSYAQKATDALRRGVILGTNTRLDMLSGEDRRKHEAMLEKMATKFALVKHAGRISKIVAQHKPELLQRSAS